MEDANSQMEDYLRASIDWSWKTDSKHNIAFLSSGFCAFSGFPGESIYGEPLEQHLSALPRCDFDNVATLSRIMEQHRPFRHLPVQILREPPVPSPFLLNGLPYYDPKSGQFLGYLGTAVKSPSKSEWDDQESTTNRHLLDLLETALKRKDELESQHEVDEEPERSHRLEVLAHELKTPLNAILGFSEVIRDKRLGPDLDRYREYAGLIHDSGEHLFEVVQTLLELERGEVPVTSSPGENSVDPVEAAAFALIVLQDQAKRMGITLTNRLPNSLPYIAADPRALRQILLNLLSNAVKYTPSGGEVVLSAEVTSDNQKLKIKIDDTGIGIRQEDSERIFDHRVQTNEARHLGDGQGLGLSIARKLALELGGTISVESTLGKGSHFTLTLPLDSRSPIKAVTLHDNKEN